MDIKVDHNTILVFDLDDTLYNELDYLKSAYRSIASYLETDNWKPLYAKMISLYRSQINVFDKLSEQYNVDSDILLEMYRNHEPSITLFDGALDLLKAIKSKNGKIGIISDGRSKTQRAKLKSLGVLDYADSIVISEEIGSEKPSLDNFKSIEKVLPGIHYYYVADNLKKDFIAPKILGWKSIALIDNGLNIHMDYYLYFDFEKNKPDKYILSMNEIQIK